MVRRKIEMKPIEDKSSMQVTFSKRRSGLMKKAKELSVLCQIDVGLVVFSPTGRVHQFFSGDSLKRIRRIHQITEDEAAAEGSAQNSQKFPPKCMDLSKGVNSIDLVQSYFEDQSIEQLNMAEITQLEHQLDTILWKTRKRKVQLLSESVLAIQAENQGAASVTGEATADGGDGGRIDPAQQQVQ